MSCNTKTSLAAVIDAVNAQLNNNYVDRDDPRIDQGVFTEPTIRGGLMLDEAAKLDFCGYVTECGQREPFGKQWVDRPLYPETMLVSYDDAGEIKSRWQDIDDVVAGTEIGESYTAFEETRRLGLEGFTLVDSFELGATLTQRDQALRHAADGKLYRWAGLLPKVVPTDSTPTNSGGISDTAWLEVSDIALRQEIVSGGLVTDSVIITAGGISQSQVNSGLPSIADLSSISEPRHGTRIFVQSYWPGENKGGNMFVYDASTPRNKHNGGSIIDPTKEWDGSREGWAFVDGYLPDVGVGVWGVDDESKLTAEVKAAILARGGDVSLGSHLNPTNFRTNQFILGGFLGKSTSTGNGCWVAQTSELNFTMFGAKGDAAYEVDGTDDSFAMIAAIRALPRKKAVLNIEPYYYTQGNGDIRNIALHFNGIKDLTIKGNTACIQSHSNNLPVSGQAILRFDYVENARIYALNTEGRLDTRMVVGSDPNTNNDQHNVHVGSGCKDILFVACRADRAMMDGFYIYGDQHDMVATRTSDITFFECHANECYRQGSSLITGLGVKWLGGSYTNTGTCKDKVTGVQKGTSPMRGIDIEANEATYLTRAEYIIDGCLLSGNRNAGASPSNNAYGTIQNCVVRDNLYIGILVEHSAKNSKLINNKFSNNANFDIWLDCTHPIKVMLNSFKTQSVPINAPGMEAHDTTLAKVDIEHNNFEPADGEEKGSGCSFDFSDVNFSHNTLRNMSPTFVGGYSKFSYNHNTFTSTNEETTFAVRTWAGSGFKSIAGNTTTLVTGTLLGEGHAQANIDYSANNSTSTDPNSGLYEIHKGKLIWNQVERVPFLEGTPTSDEIAIKVNNLIGALINRGVME